jgi:hypothetical protein
MYEIRGDIMKKISCLIGIILLLSIVITPICAEDLKFMENTSKTAFASGGYDADAVMPVTANWSRVSRFTGVDDPQLLWKKNSSIFYQLIIGRDNVKYMFNGFTVGLSAIDDNEDTLWTYKLKDFKKQGECVIGSDGTIYFTAYSEVTKSANAYYLYAVKPDGKLKWRYSNPKYVIDTTPVIDSKGRIYAAGYKDGHILRFDANGKAEVFKTIDTMDIDKLAVGADGTLFAMGQIWTKNEYGCYVLYAIGQDKKIKWKYRLDDESYFSTDLVIGADKTVYFGTSIYYNDIGGHVLAIGPNGKKKWDYDAGDVVRATPVIDNNGQIIAACGNDRYGKYFGTAKKMVGKDLGRLVALNMNGKAIWSKNLKHGFDATPIIDNRGNIYLVDNKASILAFDKKGKLLWSFDTGAELDSGETICLDSNQTLYVSSSKCIMAIGDKANQPAAADDESVDNADQPAAADDAGDSTN